MNTELSIIVAIEDTVSDETKKRSIESALKQTVDVSVILAGDYVCENTEKLLKEYEDKNPDKVKFFNTSEERWRGGALNLGFRNATSKYLAFVNCGDTLSPDFAKTLLEIASKEDADIVACGYKFDSSNDEEDEEQEEIFELWANASGELDYDKYGLLALNPGKAEARIVKRELFDKNGIWFPEHLSYEKLGVNRLLLLGAKRFAYTEEPLYIIAKDISSDISEEDLFDRIDVMNFFIEECYKREILEEYPEEIEAAVVDDMYIKTLFTYLAITPGRKRKITFLKELADAISDCFPEFETNPFYYDKYDDDIKDLVSLHMLSPFKFIKATMKMDF